MIACIKALATYLPEKIVTNEELIKEFREWSAEKIEDKIGVKQRHIAAEGETATDMAIKAAEKLFISHPELRKSDVDFVLFCTQSPDYILPTSACIIQEALNLPKNIGALDFNLGCSGYVYGLSLAKGLVESKTATNILLLTGETYSKHLHHKDKGNRTIFGDAATATLISDNGIAEIGDFVFGTDGKGAENLIIKTGGSRFPKRNYEIKNDMNGTVSSDDFLKMEGSEIFKFTQKEIPVTVENVLKKNSIEKNDIDCFIFHQANAFMLEFLRRKMKISEDKFIIDMSATGNTVSNSIPIILQKKLAEGIHGNILLCGFGVGYSWAACVLKRRTYSCINYSKCIQVQSNGQQHSSNILQNFIAEINKK